MRIAARTTTTWDLYGLKKAAILRRVGPAVLGDRREVARRRRTPAAPTATATDRATGCRSCLSAWEPHQAPISFVINLDATTECRSAASAPDRSPDQRLMLDFDGRGLPPP